MMVSPACRSMGRTYLPRRTGASRASGPRPTVGDVIAQVEPLTPARALRGPFDYRVPREMEGVEVGGGGGGSMRAVLLGPQRLQGVVVVLAERSDVPPERLVEPLKALGRG